jgi:hypothetical protein
MARSISGETCSSYLPCCCMAKILDVA